MEIAYHYTTVLNLNPAWTERRKSQALPMEPITPTPIYEKVKAETSRAHRALRAIEEILRLMEHPMVVWKLKGKLARGGFNLMPEDASTPPEMASRLAYTELQVLRLRLTNLISHPGVISAANPDPLNRVDFSADEEINILHAIRREAAAYLANKPADDLFLELKNLCQLALGNLQQMSFTKAVASVH